MEGNTCSSAFLIYISVTAINLVPEMFKEEIHVLRGFGRASQGHKFALSHDLEHECAAPGKFRGEKMVGGCLRSLVTPRKIFASGHKLQIEKKFKRPKYIKYTCHLYLFIQSYYS